MQADMHDSRMVSVSKHKSYALLVGTATYSKCIKNGPKANAKFGTVSL